MRKLIYEPEYTYTEIGKILGVSRQRVYELELIALEKIRRICADMNINLEDLFNLTKGEK